MNKFALKKIVIAFVFLAGFLSCKKAFDVMPGTELDASQMYRNVYDADAAVVGIYGKFMDLADEYVILNELRADLLTTTDNADEHLQQISNHTVTGDNPYTNPRPFYQLILNCNDALKNFTIMRQKNALKEVEYNQRYSDIACLRSFLYLQLGIHYGEVPYVTDPLETLSALMDQSRFPRIPFDVLLDSLIAFTDGLPFKDQYPTGTSLNIALDGYSTAKFFINKNCLMGDLNLWKGDYTKAAVYYREVLETATETSTGENFFSQYRIGWSDADMEVIYSRAGDASTLAYATGWRTIFEATDNRFLREWIWVLPFDNKFKPENSLIKLFSPIGGNYLVKPSQEIMDNWNSQQQRIVATTGSVNGIPYDARGLFSVKNIGGQPVAMKYLYNYINDATNLPTNPLVKNGKWFLYRQSLLHLRFAEAANRDGWHRLAYALFNSGLEVTFNTSNPNKTDLQNTFYIPDSVGEYKFDARNGTVPYFRGPWYRNMGVRGRALLQNYPITSAADSLIQIEDGLINEGALENAFEGNRWSDLLRVSMRRNDPSFIADKIYQKLIKSGSSVSAATAARAKLMNRNWFLPFKWE